jgi:hypothetical protein
MTIIEIEKINGYKFPACQKYWTIKQKDIDTNEDVFDISMGYSDFYIRGKTLQEAEDYLLRLIKEKAKIKLKAAQKVVDGLIEFLEDERVLAKEQLLEKYKI